LGRSIRNLRLKALLIFLLFKNKALSPCCQLSKASRPKYCVAMFLSLHFRDSVITLFIFWTNSSCPIFHYTRFLGHPPLLGSQYTVESQWGKNYWNKAIQFVFSMMWLEAGLARISSGPQRYSTYNSCFQTTWSLRSWTKFKCHLYHMAGEIRATKENNESRK
jgi:hypothetical protein